MKKIIALLVLLLSLTACGKQEVNDNKDLLSVIKERGTLIVATEVRRLRPAWPTW